MAKPSPGDDATVARIRKYANRRLYNTSTSEFVTLSDLATMVKAGNDFVVEDAKSGADLTSSILIQIIAEQEASGEHLLPLPYLRQLIGYYGEDVGHYLTSYLEQSMQTFAGNQQQIVEQMQGLLAPDSPMQTLARRNMELFRDTMTSLAGLGAAGASTVDQSQAKAPAGNDEIEALRNELGALKRRLDDLDRG